MKRTMFNLLALSLIAGGGAHLLAQETPATGSGDEKQICCAAIFGAKCCGNTQCRSGWWSCCTDAACDE